MKAISIHRGDVGKHLSTSGLSATNATALNMASQTDLPADDAAALAIAEGRIDAVTRAAWADVGFMLGVIRDRKLYKVKRAEDVAGRYSFETFEEYVEQRWEIDVRRAYQLIEAAGAVAKMCTKVHILPSTERQVRELLKLDNEEDLEAAWEAAVARSEGASPTARVVAEEVERLRSPRVEVEAEEEEIDDEVPDEPVMTSEEVSQPTVVDCVEDEAAGHLVDDVEAESVASETTRAMLTTQEWGQMDDDEAYALVNAPSDAKFNKQDTTSIEWAQWSWNPITGCKHDCPYCYARDIAQRFTQLYRNGFEPSIWPARFAAPENTTVPAAAANDTSYKNVFTGSMADIFGRWVPEDWIQIVLESVKDNPQWNFLFLTKFPQRIHEFGPLPKNAWMGTSVDCQERVANAEKAFSKMGGGIKWLSVEPMLTPLKFTKLDMFDWVVIGGASRSANTPAWVPPFDWVADLHAQARAAGCAVYHKDNLGFGDEIRLKEFPWEAVEEKELPSQLKYLSMK